MFAYVKIITVNLCEVSMLGYVKGILEESRPGKIVVDVNGLGFNILVSESTREELPGIGQEIKVFTHTNVREDDISLFGFLSREALDLFELLITVNGVGPKGAMGLLGIFPASEVKYLIVTSSSDKLSKAPGIGKKTAERIIIDLKDKLSTDDILTLSDIAESGEAPVSGEASDAISALVSLGYSQSEAKRAVSLVQGADTMNVNDILKAALQHLF